MKDYSLQDQDGLDPNSIGDHIGKCGPVNLPSPGEVSLAKQRLVAGPRTTYPGVKSTQWSRGSIGIVASWSLYGRCTIRTSHRR